MTDYTAKHGATITLTDTDRLVFDPAALPYDPNGDGILLPSSVTKGSYRFGASKTVYVPGAAKLKQIEGTAYGLEGYVAPVVTPPEPTGPEVVNHPDGSVTLSQNGSSITINRNGGVTALSIGGVEYIAVGASVQGFMLVQGTTKVRQSAAMAPTITNGVNDGAHWRGSTADMAIDQFVRLEADRVKFEIKADCLGVKPITRADWWADMNPSEVDKQKMSATASEARSGDVAIRSTHPAAFFYITPVWDPRVGTTLPIKTVPQSPKLFADDRSVAVGFLLNITQGNSDTVTFEVRKSA